MRNLSRRLGLNYRGDLDKAGGRFIAGDAYTLRVGGVVDGTLLAANPADFEGCDLIIDEVVQVLRHLLSSSTCNKDGMRPLLLARFVQLIKAARRVIIADADLNDDVVRYIQSLRDNPDEKTWLLVNDAKVQPWDVAFIESPDATPAIARAEKAVREGKNVFIPTDSLAGSKRLYAHFRRILNENEIRLLNSETSGGEVERNYIADPDGNRKGVRLTIGSPSFGTGVSMEAEHFDLVVGIFYGASITDADMAQALARVRHPVPRVVWCAKTGRGFSRIGQDTSPRRLKALLANKTSITAQLTAASLGAAVGTELTGYDWDNPHIDLWAKFEAERNRSMLNLRAALKVRLQEEGHNLTIERLETDHQLKAALKEIRTEIKAAEAEAIAAAANITAVEAKLLEAQENLEPDERLALTKWHLADFYCLAIEQVTAALALADDNGRRRSQLLQLEQFIHPDTASDADVRAVERQAQWNRGVCPWDVPHAALRRQIRERLGLRDFIEGGGLASPDPEEKPHSWISDDLAEFKAKAEALAPQIKAGLNISIRSGMSGAQILGQLLEQMGLTTQSQQYREDGKRKRRYRLNGQAKSEALAVLARRAERREMLRPSLPEAVTPPSFIEIDQGGCDTPKPPEREGLQPGAAVRWAAAGLTGRLVALTGTTASFEPAGGGLFYLPLADLQAG